MWLGGRCVCDMWLGMYYVNVYTTKTKIDLTKNKVNEKEQRENREKAKNSSNQTKYVDYIIQYMTLYYGFLIGQHINFYFLIFIFCPRFAPLFENYYNKYSMLCVRVGFVLSYFAIFMFVFRLSQRQWNERTKKNEYKKLRVCKTIYCYSYKNTYLCEYAWNVVPLLRWWQSVCMSIKRNWS